MTSNDNLQYTINNFKNEYGVKEVPNLKISLIDGDKNIYTFFIDSVIYYHHIYDTQVRKNECHVTASLIVAQDLEVLLSRKYEKYVIETEHTFRKAETGQDEIVYLPAQLYNNLNIDYEMTAEGEPTKWEFIFYNEYY